MKRADLFDRLGRLVLATLLVLLLIGPECIRSQGRNESAALPDCSKGVNLLLNDSNVRAFIRTVVFTPQLPSNAFQLLRNGGANWPSQSSPSSAAAAFSSAGSNNSVQIRFRNTTSICCVTLNASLTNVLEFEVQLYDERNNTIRDVDGEPLRFVSNARLQVQLSSYASSVTVSEVSGVLVTLTRTQLGQQPTKVQMELVKCDDPSLLVPRQLDNLLLNAKCETDDQCQQLMARCIKGKCTCVTGIALDEYRCVDFDFGDEVRALISKTKFNYGRYLSFREITSIYCRQDQDCLSVFFDLRMICLNQRCTCQPGQRLMQSSNYELKCVNASAGSVLRIPSGCELPFCDQQVQMFVYENRTGTGGGGGERLVSLHFVADTYHFISEYMELTIRDERMRFLIDENDRPQVVMGEGLRQLYQRLVDKTPPAGMKKRRKKRSRVDVESGDLDGGSFGGHPNVTGFVHQEAKHERHRRYILNQLAQAVVARENIFDYIAVVDYDEQVKLPNFVQFNFVNTGNLTYFNIEFDGNFSRYILGLLGAANASASVEEIRALCTPMKFIKSNFIQLNPGNTQRSAFFFEHKSILRVNNFQFCFADYRVLNPQTSVVNSSDYCLNGLVLHDSTNPSRNFTNRTYCMCYNGFIGPACDQLSPCYTIVSNLFLKLLNFTEPMVRLSKICENDGMCLPVKAPLPYLVRTGQRLTAQCLCKQQYGGKSCDRNLDSCLFPFLYNGKLQDKCLVDPSTGQPWCAIVDRNYDRVRLQATCKSIPCRTPFKYKSNYYFHNCPVKYRYTDDRGTHERPFCSLTRNFDLLHSWRNCELEDIN